MQNFIFCAVGMIKKPLFMLFNVEPFEKSVGIDKYDAIRSSPRRCSVKKGVLKNFAKIHRKAPVPESLFYKVAGLKPKACSFIKKETLAQVFSCEFCETSQNTFSTEHFQTTAPVQFS